MFSKKQLVGFAIIAALTADQGRAGAQTPPNPSPVTPAPSIPHLAPGALTNPGGASIVLSAGSIVTSSSAVAVSGGLIVTGDVSNVTTRVSLVGSVAPSARFSVPPLGGLLLLPLGVDLVALASGANQLAVARAVTFASAKTVSVSPDVEIRIGLPPLALRAQLDAASGAGLAGAQSAAIRLGAAASSVIADQAAFWRSGETNDATGIISRESVAGALGYVAAERRDGLIVLKGAPVFTRTWRAWGSFFGGAADISTDAGRGSPAMRSDYYGGIIGLDYQIDPSWLVGVAAGGGSSSFTVASQQTSGDVTAFHGGIYTSYLVGRSYVELSETFSVFQNSTLRGIGGFGLPYDRLTADFSAREYRTRAEIGHSFVLPRQIEFGSAKLTPFVAAEVAVYESDAFSEKSLIPKDSLALTIAEQTTTSLPTFLGLRLSNILSFPDGWRVTPTGSVAWAHEFFPQRRLTNAFIALPGTSFTVFGPREASNFVQTKIGLQADVDARVALFADFQGEFSDVARRYGGKAGLKYSW